MNELGVVVVVLVIVVIAAAIWEIRKRANMMAEGVILHRGLDFMKNAETFTCSMESTEKVTEGLQKINYAGMKASMKSNSAAQSFRFAGVDWGAQLRLTGEKDGTYTYRFEFTDWNAGNGVASNADHMNMLLTAIEKMFLEIDPSTKVKTEALQVKTKTNLF